MKQPVLALLGEDAHEHDHVDEGDDDDDEHDPDPPAARLVDVRLQPLALHLQRAVVPLRQLRARLQLLKTTTQRSLIHMIRPYLHFDPHTSSTML